MLYFMEGYTDRDNKMRHEDLDSSFIFSLMTHCQNYEGIRDLMELWIQETDPNEKAKIIADLQEDLDDIKHLPSEEHSFLHYDDLMMIRKDIVEFKNKLREEVDRHGGISELSRKTGIPQPSLSRLFSSASIPRRTTLYKIAKALNLPNSSVGFKWVT